jgi:ketosteroid isomerase-like protein
MKRATAFLAVAATVAGCTLPFAPSSTMNAPASLAAAESAFAAHSVREDLRAAFLANFAKDGVYVREGWTVTRTDLEKQAAPPIVLDWRPVYAETARSGEMGLSTGPWKITSKAKADTPPAFGQFVSIWRRAPEGRWLVEVDLGISHPQTALWQAPLKTSSVGETPTPRETLAAAEKRFAAMTSGPGVREAYARNGAEDMRFYRTGSQPIEGKALALQSTAIREGPFAWTIERSETAKSGDFGYARGSYADPSAPAKPLGYFVRVWRVERGEWRIVLDVTNPARPG